MTAQSTQAFPLPLLPPGKTCSSLNYFNQVMAYMFLLHKLLHKPAGKSSTNIIHSHKPISNALQHWEWPRRCKIPHTDNKLHSIKYI